MPKSIDIYSISDTTQLTPQLRTIAVELLNLGYAITSTSEVNAPKHRNLAVTYATRTPTGADHVRFTVTQQPTGDLTVTPMASSGQPLPTILTVNLNDLDGTDDNYPGRVIDAIDTYITRLQNLRRTPPVGGMSTVHPDNPYHP